MPLIIPLSRQPLFPFSCVLYLRQPLHSFNFIRTAANKGTNIYSMEEGECSTNLGLAIGGGGKEYKPSAKFHVLFPQHSLTMKEEEEEDDDYEDVEQSSKQNVSILRCTNFDEEEAISGSENSRKKLKLTKEQIMLLEDNFREHKTLNTPQKQHLADRLNIQPRQVEVWFQNRRARTKLKQIEVDYEILRKHCDRLTDENQRLREELQELQSRSP